jgi:hypothetical protein
MDGVVVIGVGFTVMQTVVFLWVTYRAERRAMNDAGRAQTQSRRPVMVMAAFTLVSWSAVGLDYYDRHSFAPPIPDAVVRGWGLALPNGFSITVATSYLTKYKHDHKMALIVQIPDANVDRMADTHIVKSELHTITASRKPLATWVLMV